MRVSMKSKNGPVPDAVRQHAEKKVLKLERYFRRIDSVVFEEATERGQHILELTLEGDDLTLRSEERCGDAYAAVDNVIEKMERQIKRFKTRVRRSHQRPGPVKEATADSITGLGEAPDTEADEEGEGASLPPIVRRKRFPMKPMSAEEAARQMELLDHNFFLFLNEESGTVNVLYRRRTGDYGLIQPEG